MKRDFSIVLKDLDGEPVRLGGTAESVFAAVNVIFPKLSAELQKEYTDALEKHATRSLTFGAACVGALMGAYEDERQLDDDIRLRRMELARRINQGGVQDIEPKDRDLIKPLLKKKWMGILVPVLCAELLETDAEPPKDGKS